MSEPGIHHRYPMGFCPACGYAVDAASSLYAEHTAPSDGDVVICLKCGEPAIFFAEGLRLATPEEHAEIMEDPGVREHMDAVRHSAYKNPKFSERACDRCGKPYRGPAVYCSFECAVEDA